VRDTFADPVRAVLFDMDGVLVFSEDAWFAVYNETLEGFGHAAISRPAFDAIYGNGTKADRDAYMPERTVAEVDAAYERLFTARLDRIRPNPEAANVLRELRAMGVATSVATNTNRPLAGRILEAQGLLGLVDAVTGADEAGAGKPDPAVVRLAAARAGAPLDACLFVGDSRYEGEAGRRAPVRFVGYRHGSAERIETLAALPALVAPAGARTRSPGAS
jgi:phosphoglycolate phosphatase/AHBA synthesis associated protein